jgi:long-subunit acyl-CoA synthetase (AMP-forming)
MKGYMGDEESTRKVFDSEGYFDTGDLMREDASTGHLVLTGRAKDTSKCMQ